MKQFVDLKRLADEIPRATLDRLHRVFHRAKAGHDNGDDLGIARDGGFDDRGPIDAGKAQIRDDDVEGKIGEVRQCCFA